MLWISPQVTPSLFVGSHVLLVIAHPDDEAMFFSPLLFALRGRCKVSMLCLSTGNADGLGTIRRHELVISGENFNISPQDIIQIDDSMLQDGMATKWPHDAVAAHVLSAIDTRQPDAVVTFDASGVSKHPNHIATYHGVRQALFSRPNIRGLQLQTTNLFRKFLGIIDIPYSILTADIAALCWNVLSVYYAMSLHRSQFVWYRRIFILLSRYTYVNTFAFIT